MSIPKWFRPGVRLKAPIPGQPREGVLKALPAGQAWPADGSWLWFPFDNGCGAPVNYAACDPAGEVAPANVRFREFL